MRDDDIMERTYYSSDGWTWRVGLQDVSADDRSSIYVHSLTEPGVQGACDNCRLWRWRPYDAVVCSVCMCKYDADLSPRRAADMRHDNIKRSTLL